MYQLGIDSQNTKIVIEIIIWNCQILKLILRAQRTTGKVVSGFTAGFSNAVFVIQNQRASIIGAGSVGDKVFRIPGA